MSQMMMEEYVNSKRNSAVTVTNKDYIYIPLSFKYHDENSPKIEFLKGQWKLVEKYKNAMLTLMSDYPHAIKESDRFQVKIKQSDAYLDDVIAVNNTERIVSIILAMSEQEIRDLITKTVGIDGDTLDYALVFFINYEVRQSSRSHWGINDLEYMYWGKNGYFFDYAEIRPITPETYSHYQTLIKNYTDEVLKLQRNPTSLYYPGLDGLGDFFNATPLEQFLAKEAFGPVNKYSLRMHFKIKQYPCIHAWVTMKVLMKYVKPAFFSTDYCTDMVMNICSALSDYYVSYDSDRPRSNILGLPDDYGADSNSVADDVNAYLTDEILIPIVDKAVREYSKVFDIFNTIETHGLSLDHFTTRYSERYFNLNNGRRHSSISSFKVTTSEDDRLKDYFSIYCLIKEYDFDDSCLKYFNKGGTYQTTRALLVVLGITPAKVVKKFTDALRAKVKGNRFLSEILNPKHLSNFLDDVSIVSQILIRYKRTFASIGRTRRPMSIVYNDLLLTPAEATAPYRSNVERIDIHCGFERGLDLTPLSAHASLRDIFINIRKSFADIFMTPLKSGHKGNYQSLLEEGESIYVAIIYFWLYKYKNWFDGTTKVSTCGLTLNVHNHTVIKKYGDTLFERFEMGDAEAFSFLPENSNIHPKDFF